MTYINQSTGLATRPYPIAHGDSTVPVKAQFVCLTQNVEFMEHDRSI